MVLTPLKPVSPCATRVYMCHTVLTLTCNFRRAAGVKKQRSPYSTCLRWRDSRRVGTKMEQRCVRGVEWIHERHRQFVARRMLGRLLLTKGWTNGTARITRRQGWRRRRWTERWERWRRQTRKRAEHHR